MKQKKVLANHVHIVVKGNAPGDAWGILFVMKSLAIRAWNPWLPLDKLRRSYHIVSCGSCNIKFSPTHERPFMTILASCRPYRPVSATPDSRRPTF